MKGVEIAKSLWERKVQVFGNYREVAKKLKKVAVEITRDENLRVIVFGSVVRGDYTPLSDLDILIVSEKASEIPYGVFVSKIEEKMDLFGVEIHFATPELFENRYKRFLDVFEEV